MHKFLIILFILSGFLPQPVYCQYDTINNPYAVIDTLSESFGLFDNDELLEISLRFDITYYKKKKPVEEYLNAILTYHTENSINKTIKVRSRGAFRRTFCDFPPLMLNFEMRDTLLAGTTLTNKLKMVTHCRTGDAEYLLKEYLTYKLYNILTDNSFRVRLLRVNYYDTAKRRKPVSEFAFVIEPVEVLAKRLNSVEVLTTALTQRNINPEIVDRMAIFNYMIGNTDWTVPNQHNVELLARAEADRPGLRTIVPFDFDFAGLVNAPYAIPADGYGLKSVRDRHYFGICRSEDEFRNALDEFSDKKEEFFTLIRKFPYLSLEAKSDMLNYLDEFFIGIDNQYSLVSKFLEECQKF